MTQIKPWYREPWFWLVALPPIAAVLGGVTTVVIAVQNADSPVADRYDKIGFGVNTDNSQDQRALALGLSAELRLDSDQQRAYLKIYSVPPTTDNFQLDLIHSTDPRRDLHFALPSNPDNYFRIELPASLNGRWQIHLSPADQSWRLRGQWLANDPAISGSNIELRGGP